MKKIILATVISMIGVTAFAAQTNTGCQGNCGGDTTTVNNQGGQGGNSVAFGGAGGSAVGVGVGGAGGQGGSGGSVVGSGNGTGIGVGGAVVGSGNSQANGGSVKNAGNSQNTNRNDNQNQNKNANNSRATSYGSVATTSTSTSVSVGGDTYEAPRIPVSTAYAPNIMPTAVCMGSSSVGGQGMSFGFSLGSSWTDANCMLLEQVRTVSVVLGQKDVAQEMMMAVPAYADAVKRLEAKRNGVTAERLPKAEPMEFVRTKYELYGN